MDANRFDAFAKTLALRMGMTRRRVLRRFAGVGAGAALLAASGRRRTNVGAQEATPTTAGSTEVSCENNEKLKAVASQFFELVSTPKFDQDLADRVLAPGYVLYVANEKLDRQGLEQSVGEFFKGFPDLKLTVDEMVAEGNSVATRLTFTGTQTGDFQNIQPSGASVAATFTVYHHFDDEFRIIEDWHPHPCIFCSICWPPVR